MMMMIVAVCNDDNGDGDDVGDGDGGEDDVGEDVLGGHQHRA